MESGEYEIGPLFGLRGRVVVLTGASGSIGRQILNRLTSAGATVCAVDRNVSALRGDPAIDRVLLVEADVGSEIGARAVQEAVSGLQRVDILINNAGYFPAQTFDTISYSDWSEVVRINLDGVFLMTRAVLPLMRQGGSGRIVNVGSASVFRGVADQVHYVAAKAGVIGLSRSLARALGPEGITVNVVAPGLTTNPASLAIFGEQRIAAMDAGRCIPRSMHPNDVVGAVLFLASPMANFITGQVLVVDGGSMMH
jgi:NAD(P)-dependent dehydrogenase (short-subunit alcohol dehydrogenase family)